MLVYLITYYLVVFYLLDSTEMSCLTSRLPTAGGAVASEWEAGVWIVQSDHGATWRRALFSGSGWSGAFWLWGLCVHGQQQAGGSNVLGQTKSGDVSVETTLNISFGWRLFGSRLIWIAWTLTWHGQLFTATWKAAYTISSQNGCVCSLLPWRGL